MAKLLTRLKERQAGSRHAAYIDRIQTALPDGILRIPKATHARRDDQPPRMPAPAPLTQRELQVARLLATDLSLQEIAARLTISSATMYTHTKNIYRKLDVHKRVEAVQRARELGLIL